MPHRRGHRSSGRPRQMSTTQRRVNTRAQSSSTGRAVHGGGRYLISTGSGTNITHYSCPSPTGITSGCQDVTNEVQVNQTLTGRTELPHNRQSRVMSGGTGTRPPRRPNPNSPRGNGPSMMRTPRRNSRRNGY